MPSGWFDGLHGLHVKLRYRHDLLTRCNDGLLRLASDGVLELDVWVPETRRPFEKAAWEEDMEFVSKHLARARMLTETKS